MNPLSASKLLTYLSERVLEAVMEDLICEIEYDEALEAVLKAEYVRRNKKDIIARRLERN